MTRSGLERSDSKTQRCAAYPRITTNRSSRCYAPRCAPRTCSLTPTCSISVLHLLDLAIDVASQCLHTKDDKASASKFGKAPPPHAQAPSPFDRTLVKKLEHMASVLQVSLNIRRKVR